MFIYLFQFPGISAYCMSKAAVDQLTRTTALGKYLSFNIGAATKTIKTWIKQH